MKLKAILRAFYIAIWLIDWAGFNVSINTVQVIWETVLQFKRPNQQYQSTEGYGLAYSSQSPQRPLPVLFFYKNHRD